MKEKEAIPILKELGWRCGKDEVGDYVCSMELEEIIIDIMPTIRKSSNYFSVTFMPSVSTKAFSSAASFIRGKKYSYEPIIRDRRLSEEVPSLSKEDIVRLSEEAIAWGKSQDIEKGLAAYRTLPTDSKGAMPLRHLAALALAADIEKLMHYKRSFEQGDRLGFALYITLELIDRALSIAQKEKP